MNRVHDVDERLRSLQQRPVTAEDEFSLSRDVVPIQYTYAAPQYSAAPTPSVQRSPTVDLLLKSFDGDNQRRDSATVSMQLGLSVSQRASEVRHPSFGCVLFCWVASMN
jgi:hypothetical protein